LINKEAQFVFAFYKIRSRLLFNDTNVRRKFGNMNIYIKEISIVSHDHQKRRTVGYTKKNRNFSKPQKIKSQRKISKKVRTYLVVVVFGIEDMGMAVRT
jgi:hypothetical protein